MGLSPLRRLRDGGTFLALLALAGSGCGPGTGTVSGKITINGKPLGAGNVTFVSSAGKPSASTTIKEDGTYSLRVPVGTVTICVETESLNPAGKIRPPHYKPPPGQKAPEGLDAKSTPEEIAAKRYVPIPKQYADQEKSGLTYEVTGGAQEHNIELK